MENSKNVYSLKSKYYTKTFDSVRELINDLTVSGADPSYNITRNGKDTGECAADLIVH